MLRTILLLPIVLGSLTFGLSAGPAREPDLAGVYVCSGKNPDGTTYEGIVEIVKHNDVFQLLWIVESEVIGVGIGIRSGNVLAVAYYSGHPGVVAYRIEGGNRLVGEWTDVDADGVLSFGNADQSATREARHLLFRRPDRNPLRPRAFYLIPRRPPD